MPSEGVVTVALPTCEGARHIEAALRSIQDQAGPAFDWLLVDDRSQDDTVALARRLAGDRLRVEVNSERLGLAGNWDRCVALSRYEWVAVFHQDDIMRPGHLIAHNEAIARRPDAGLVCSAVEVIDEQGGAVAESVVPPGGLGPSDRVFEPGTLVRELAVENPLRCSGVTLSRRAQAAVGGFDPTLRYVVDWDFWLRVAARYPVLWLARPSVAIRWHLGSETHRFKTGTTDLDEQMALLERLHATEAAHWPDADSLRSAASKRLGRAFLNRAYVAAKAGDHALVRHALGRALKLNPTLVGSILADPRLALRLAAAMFSRPG